MEPIDTSEEIWKGKVIRYRKWEQRHDRSVDPLARKNYGKILAEFYVDLSNTARAIVQKVTNENGASWTDTEKPLRDETWTTVFGSHRYTLKHTHEDPTRIWFQRFEHEPWFDLGYWNDKEGCFQDVPIDRDLIMRNRAIDMAHTRKVGFNHIVQAQSMTNFDHVHMAMTNTDPAVFTQQVNELKGTDMNSDSPEALEAAAAHAMARAAELRAIDDREPTGEEATISWEWTPEYEGARTYTFVAFRSDNGTWYATGQNMCRDGMKWRDMANHKMGGALRNGAFHIVTEWSQVGGDE